MACPIQEVDEADSYVSILDVDNDLIRSDEEQQEMGINESDDDLVAQEESLNVVV